MPTWAWVFTGFVTFCMIPVMVLFCIGAAIMVRELRDEFKR